MSPAICFNLQQSKILSSGNDLTEFHEDVEILSQTSPSFYVSSELVF